MAGVKFAKVVSALPGTLVGDTLYAVRVGTGFDLYITSDPTLGTITAKKVNDTDISGKAPLSGVGLPYDYPFAMGDEATALTTGQKISFHFPRAITITGIKADLSTVSSSGAVTVDVKKNGTTIFSTKITIDASEVDNSTAAVAAVLSVTTIAANDVITGHVDGAGTGSKGLKVCIMGTLA